MEAFKDYKYLLNRGYSRKVALDAVASRYLISVEEKLILYRCCHSEQEIRGLLSRKVDDFEKLAIDGYNIALTLSSAIYGDPVFICDDGFLRDISSGRKKKDEDLITDSLVLISDYLPLRDFEVFLDSQVSGSGVVAKRLREKRVKVNLTKRVDSSLISSGLVVASNDFLVLNMSKRIFNLLEKLVANYGIEVSFDFRRVEV